MQGSIDYLTLAERDIKMCELAEKEFPAEYAYAAATYHIQQAIEKLLKGLILINGETPEFTHNIAKLKVHCADLGIYVSPELEDIADSLTLWESSSRYDTFIDFSNEKYGKAKSIYNDLSGLLQTEIAAVQFSPDTSL